jgi:type VII secretion-associated serine protease mycosin
VHDSQWALQASDAGQAWKISRGGGVTVAVIDSGVDASHPDLRDQVEPGVDYGDGSSGDGTHDSGPQRGHGTEVASLIAGTAANYGGDGLSGLAPDAKILSYGVYRDGKPDAAAAGKAIRAATDRGAKVVVVATSGTTADPSLQSAVKDAIGRGVIVVSGVGDDPTSAEPTYPAAIPGVVAVTAVDRDGRLWSRAARSPDVVIAAPGVSILAASSDGSYWTGDDTGYAAAWVAGAATLVRAAHPDWSAAQVIEKLISTARRGIGIDRSEEFGFGLLDPLRAVSDKVIPAVIESPLLPSGAPPRPNNVIKWPNRRNPARFAPVAGTIATASLLLLLIGALIVIRRRGNGKTTGTEGLTEGVPVRVAESRAGNGG